MADRAPAAASLRLRLARGIAWNTIGAAFNQGSTFVVNIVLAHLLIQRAFGQYALVQTTLSVVSTLAQLSSGYTATRYVAEFRDRDPARAARILGLCGTVSLCMGLVAGTALLLASERLAAVVNDPHLARSFAIAAPVLFFSITTGFLSGALAGFESYAAYGRAGIASGTAYALLCAAGGWYAGVEGAIAGMALSGLFQTTLLARLVWREARVRDLSIHPSDAWHERAILLRFSVPAALNGFVSLPAIWTVNAFLARQDRGFEQVALFTAANSFRIIVLFLPNIFNGVGMSLLNNQRGAGDERRFRRLFWTAAAISAAVVVVAGTIFALSGGWLLNIFGSRFVAAHPALIVLMLAALAETLSLAAWQVIQTQERIWLSFFGVAGPSAIALVATARLLVPAHGAVGLAWAYVASWILALAIEWIIVWRVGIWTAPATPLAPTVSR